jgi:hypothetical protein
MDDSDFIEVVWGPEVYTPVAFHTLTIGPFKRRTKLRPGETEEQAGQRVWDALNKMAQAIFNKQKGEYLNRVGEYRKEALTRAKAARDTG